MIFFGSQIIYMHHHFVVTKITRFPHGKMFPDMASSNTIGTGSLGPSAPSAPSEEDFDAAPLMPEGMEPPVLDRSVARLDVSDVLGSVRTPARSSAIPLCSQRIMTP